MHRMEIEEAYFSGLDRASERRQDEVEKLFAQFRVRVPEKTDSGSAGVGTDSDNGRIKP